MKAQELRIGNLVQDRASIRYQVTAEDIAKLEASEQRGKINIDFNPIPLTEEWLLKFGFKPTDFQPKEFIKGDFIVYLHNPVNREVYFGIWDTKVKYVHQLQNLYYALTGQELTPQ